MTEADYQHEFCNPMISQTFADQWVLLVGKKFAKFFLYTVVNELEQRLDLVLYRRIYFFEIHSHQIICFYVSV